jgi:hypothetical protein
MNPPETSTTDTPSPLESDSDPPPGNHALEIAARAGFGPLSPLGRKAWHGDAAPCVSCGQLVRREETVCDRCGQDLSEEMLDKMRAHAGPWFVLEHVRPFPGVSLERIIRQIRRGLITETSIVRGPSTDYQWRFAVETPGLCRCFGRCWHCHQQVSLTDTYCRHCLSSLSFEKPRSIPPAPAATSELVPGAPVASGLVPGANAPPIKGDATTQIPVASGLVPGATIRAGSVSDRLPPPFPRGDKGGSSSEPGAQATGGLSDPRAESIRLGEARADRAVSPNRQSTIDNRQSPIVSGDGSPELARLSAAIRQANVPQHVTEWDEPPRVAGVRATWIAAALMLIAVVVLLLISRARSDRPLPPPSAATNQTQPAAQSAPVLLPPTPSPAPSPPSTDGG